MHACTHARTHTHTHTHTWTWKNKDAVIEKKKTDENDGLCLTEKGREFRVLAVVLEKNYCPCCFLLALRSLFIEQVLLGASSWCLFSFHYGRQIQGVVYMLVAQAITQPLPLAERGIPNACGTNGTSTSDGSGDFTPEDWTGSWDLLNIS